MRKGESPSQVLKAVKTESRAAESPVLPKGVEVVPYY
jgi:hypothetical protein